MDKLKMHTPNKVDENLEKIGALFPNALTETIKGYNDDGSPIIERAIDFDILKQELSNVVVEGNEERYQFTWPDKKKSILLANAPIAKTLRPCREESVDFDTTENLYIEGDNLDVLKLLQETYLGKVKMIYIDPPYNTGKDFVYEDDFAQSSDDYLMTSGQFDEEGNRLFQNTESNGRFHTDWLNMIYPRLKLAKDLLSDDGVIFISIDDNEVENLKKLCNEIFGEENFIVTFVWNTEGHTDNQYDVKINHEYTCLYSKSKATAKVGYVIDPNTREESNLWKGYAENSITKNGPANPVSEVILPIGFPCKVKNVIIKANVPEDTFFAEVIKQKYISRAITDKYSVSYPIRFNDTYVENYLLTSQLKVFSGWANVNKLKDFIKNNCQPFFESDGSEVSFYLSENGVIYCYKKRDKARNIVSVLKNMGTTEQMRSELEKNEIYFSYPKPLKLIQYLIKVGIADNEGIVLDFFSGSATTAHSVLQLNAIDGFNCKYILVQLPEETITNSEANKAGYQNICEIAKKRIRWAGNKIKEEAGLNAQNLDTGFRVLKVDSTNMKDVYYNPSEYTQNLLSGLDDNFKDDRTPEDLLFQVMLDLGVPLSSKIEEKDIAGKKVFAVAENYLIACFDKNVSDEVVTAIAKQKPYYAVFRDSGIATDSVATNFEQIFTTYSPTTVRKVL